MDSQTRRWRLVKGDGEEAADGHGVGVEQGQQGQQQVAQTQLNLTERCTAEFSSLHACFASLLNLKNVVLQGRAEDAIDHIISR